MKVGKAIYNILAQSTDVQSNFPFNTTDYAPTGTELVTNGDFAGITELVTNGNFATDLDGWTQDLSRGSYTWDNDRAKITNNAASNYPNLSQNIVTIPGKTYKVTANIEIGTAPTVEVRVYSGGVLGSQQLTANGTIEFNFTAVGTNPLLLLYLWETGNTGNYCFFDNISVKELGEGWTLGTGWSIGDSKAISTLQSGSQYLTQSSVVESGKSYKVTFEVIDYTSGSVKATVSGDEGEARTAIGTYTEYLNATGTTFSIKNQSGAFIGSISNVSAQEMILTKIFPELAPPDIDAPYIVYSVVSNSPSETKNANGDIDTASIEVYGFQDTYNKAVDLGVSVRAALDRKTGTYNTIEIQSTNYVNEQMDVNEARKLWAAIQDYSIRIKNI